MPESKTITVEGKDYRIDGFSDEQKYMLRQIEDLTNKSGNLQFQLDQLIVAKDFFSERLISSLEDEEA